MNDVAVEVRPGRAWWTWMVIADGRVVCSGVTIDKSLAERRAESWRRIVSRAAE